MLCVNISDERSIFKTHRKHNIISKGKPLLFDLIEKQLGIGIVPVKHGGGVMNERRTVQRTLIPLELNLITDNTLIISNRSSSTVSVDKQIGRILKRLIIDTEEAVRITRTDINSHGFAGTLQQELFPLTVLLHRINEAVRKILAPVRTRHDNVKGEVKAAEMRLLTAIAENLTKTRERFAKMLTGRAGNL